MCVKTKIRLLFVSFLGTDYTENTDELEKSREIRVVRA